MTAVTRRDFLSAAVVAPFGLNRQVKKAKNCIVLVLTGGPSQLDTWDPKPDAPVEIRGPFRPIRTNVPGIEISEIFPRMAKHADKYALIRSVYSDAAPDTHEGNLKLIDAATEGYITLPGPLGFMGSEPVYHPTRDPQSFAENCQRARQLIESGIPRVRVNMFETVFHRPTWDSHGAKPFSTIRDYKDTVAPTFDVAYSALLEDLHQRGLLESTRVIALGEFGRTPRINPSGGRDHWTRCQTVLLAGGGIEGGQVYGSSDATGSEPKDNPVSMETLLTQVANQCGWELARRSNRSQSCAALPDSSSASVAAA